MLEVFAYVLPSTLFSLVGAYVYVEAQKRKAIKEKKKAIIRHVASIKNNFKEEVKRFVEQEVLTINQYKLVYAIANNFFIYQPVTIKSIAFCEHSLNNVISAIQNGGPETIYFDRVQQQVSVFTAALPVTANGYNRLFYQQTLPKLIDSLVSAKEDIYNVDNTVSCGILSKRTPSEAA